MCSADLQNLFRFCKPPLQAPQWHEAIVGLRRGYFTCDFAGLWGRDTVPQQQSVEILPHVLILTGPIKLPTKAIVFSAGEEVAASLDAPSEEAIDEELAALGLLEYVKKRRAQDKLGQK